MAAASVARQRQRRPLWQAVEEKGRTDVTPDTSAARILFQSEGKMVHRPAPGAKDLKRVAERARISQEVTPHVLRHTFATLAIQKGISLAAIQKILGHDRLATTAIYLNLTDTHVVDEYSQKW